MGARPPHSPPKGWPATPGVASTTPKGQLGVADATPRASGLLI
jgi:hypothetical protein